MFCSIKETAAVSTEIQKSNASFLSNSTYPELGTRALTFAMLCWNIYEHTLTIMTGLLTLDVEKKTHVTFFFLSLWFCYVYYMYYSYIVAYCNVPTYLNILWIKNIYGAKRKAPNSINVFPFAAEFSSQFHQLHWNWNECISSLFLGQQ